MWLTWINQLISLLMTIRRLLSGAYMPYFPHPHSKKKMTTQLGAARYWLRLRPFRIAETNHWLCNGAFILHTGNFNTIGGLVYSCCVTLSCCHRSFGLNFFEWTIHNNRNNFKQYENFYFLSYIGKNVVL